MAKRAVKSRGHTHTQKPSNIKVVRKNKGVSDYEPVHPTIDGVFNEEQYSNPYNKIKNTRDIHNIQSNDNTETQRTQNEQVSYSEQRTSKIDGRTSTQKIVGTLNTKKKARKIVGALRATWIIIGVCWTLYIAQVTFWFLFLAGLGLEYGGMSASDFYTSGNFLLKWGMDVIEFFLPFTGRELVVVGWITSSILCAAQLYIALGVFYINGVNALSGNNLKNFALCSAFCFFPLAIVPWALIWMIGVIKN